MSDGVSGPFEEPAGDWRTESASSLLARLRAHEGTRRRPIVVGLDGRSGSGKSTTATLLATHHRSATVVHTDDVAWNLSFFDWADQLIDGVLKPLRTNGSGISCRPAPWDEHGREGAIRVAPTTTMVIVEGVGAGRRELTPWLDDVVWVQSDLDAAREAALTREGNTTESSSFWDEWQTEEIPFLDDQRPWERAAFMIAGTGVTQVAAIEPDSFWVSPLR